MELVAQIIILVCTLVNAFSVGMYFGIEKGYQIAKDKKEDK